MQRRDVDVQLTNQIAVAVAQQVKWSDRPPAPFWELETGSWEPRTGHRALSLGNCNWVRGHEKATAHRDFGQRRRSHWNSLKIQQCVCDSIRCESSAQKAG